MRIEKDSLGELAVPDTAYYGVQTERAKKNFDISNHTIDELPIFIRAIAEIKNAAALANNKIGALSSEYCEAICKAADEIIEGNMHGQFPVDILQGGGSTSTNMNANEVIANRANEILLGKKCYSSIHPNTHVNMGQSTNDVIPAAIEIACYRYSIELEKSLVYFEKALAKKAEEFKDVVKASRTCIQDAVPITLGQEFSGYRDFVRRHIKLLKESIINAKLCLPLGATASGTGLGTFPGYMEEVYKQLKEVTTIDVEQNQNLFDGLQNGDFYIRLSAFLKSLATGLGKIARDLRIMSSGPRTGFNEINLPAVQPGSSIMPGKINPVMPELMNQVAYQVCGNDVAVTMSVEGGELDLNVWEPVIVKNLTEAFTILTKSLPLFADLCIDGITANTEVCQKHAESTLANATVVSAILGYETGTKVAKKAYETGKTIKEVVLEDGILPKSEVETLLNPLTITDYKQSSKIIGMEKIVAKD